MSHSSHNPDCNPCKKEETRYCKLGSDLVISYSGRFLDCQPHSRSNERGTVLTRGGQVWTRKGRKDEWKTESTPAVHLFFDTESGITYKIDHCCHEIKRYEPHGRVLDCTNHTIYEAKCGEWVPICNLGNNKSQIKTIVKCASIAVGATAATAEQIGDCPRVLRFSEIPAEAVTFSNGLVTVNLAFVATNCAVLLYKSKVCGKKVIVAQLFFRSNAFANVLNLAGFVRFAVQTPTVGAPIAVPATGAAGLPALATVLAAAAALLPATLFALLGPVIFTVGGVATTNFRPLIWNTLDYASPAAGTVFPALTAGATSATPITPLSTLLAITPTTAAFTVGAAGVFPIPGSFFTAPVAGDYQFDVTLGLNATLPLNTVVAVTGLGGLVRTNIPTVNLVVFPAPTAAVPTPAGIIVARWPLAANAATPALLAILFPGIILPIGLVAAVDLLESQTLTGTVGVRLPAGATVGVFVADDPTLVAGVTAFSVFVPPVLPVGVIPTTFTTGFYTIDPTSSFRGLLVGTTDTFVSGPGGITNVGGGAGLLTSLTTLLGIPGISATIGFGGLTGTLGLGLGGLNLGLGLGGGLGGLFGLGLGGGLGLAP